ncbi:hypothetical protein Dda_8742 [Drechslerella dactyloides]|uniref:Trichothecene 3-O-acetyltransferase-like N-terminal domain-containing protein n=1 Tax=Drechslerella dactyloides TaxID=74499 RepID=A0AAD6IUY8_DREDA|nr:hypothetical protein Dda_8742 [Drechslerella dactyloides]
MSPGRDADNGSKSVGPLDDFYLDTLGQQGTPVYTQICFCYALPDSSSEWYPKIIETLHAGFQRFADSFPWVAGQVVNEGAGQGSSGVYKIKPLEKKPLLIVKDMREDPDAPTMESLRQAEFPFRMLDESVICPRPTLILPGTATLEVCLVQLTLVTGGLLFSFLGHHAVMDGVGQGQVMHLLNKACRNEPFTAEELATGNAPRRDIIPILDDSYTPGAELNHQLFAEPATPPPLPDPPLPPPPEKFWAYFVFPPQSLVELKANAAASLASGYISTDDSVTALVWQCVTRARLPRLDPNENVTLARAVDVRGYLGVPATYPGLAQNMTYHSSTAGLLTDMAAMPLGAVATNLRAALDPKTSELSYMTRAMATYIHRAADKKTINITATLDLAKDIMLSSWAKLPCYEFDFGMRIGMPEVVRRPQFTPVESLMYLMPRRPDGEFVLALCLREDDMERLVADPEFNKYCRFVF